MDLRKGWRWLGNAAIKSSPDVPEKGTKKWKVGNMYLKTVCMSFCGSHRGLPLLQWRCQHHKKEGKEKPYQNRRTPGRVKAQYLMPSRYTLPNYGHRLPF